MLASSTQSWSEPLSPATRRGWLAARCRAPAVGSSRRRRPRRHSCRETRGTGARMELGRPRRDVDVAEDGPDPIPLRLRSNRCGLLMPPVSSCAPVTGAVRRNSRISCVGLERQLLAVGVEPGPWRGCVGRHGGRQNQRHPQEDSKSGCRCSRGRCSHGRLSVCDTKKGVRGCSGLADAFGRRATVLQRGRSITPCGAAQRESSSGDWDGRTLDVLA